MFTRRIIGTELEYAAAFQTEDGSFDPCCFHTEAGTMLESLPVEFRGFGTFLPNGGRFYIDNGSHPEYATPEDDSILGVTADEIAGDEIVCQTVEQAAAECDAKGFAVNRRVMAPGGAFVGSTAWGYHENYCVSRLTYDDPVLRGMAALHVITRAIFAGAGGLDHSGNFVISQKAPALTDTFHTGSTGSAKPIIIDRDDEPLADPARFGRLHISGGDPNMSPWATRIKLGTTSIVLDLFDAGFRDLAPNERLLPLAARRLAGDLALKTTVTLADGSEMTALQIQFKFLEAAEEVLHKFDEEKREAIGEWRRALEDLAALGPNGLLDRADYPCRLRFITQAEEKRGYNMQQLFNLDYRWDWLDKRGIGMMLRDRLWEPWMPDRELVQQRMTTPPPSTRAFLRGRAIRCISSMPDGVCRNDINWHTVRLPGTALIRLDNPYSNFHLELDERLAAAGF